MLSVPSARWDSLSGRGKGGGEQRCPSDSGRRGRQTDRHADQQCGPRVRPQTRELVWWRLGLGAEKPDVVRRQWEGAGLGGRGGREEQPQQAQVKPLPCPLAPSLQRLFPAREPRLYGSLCNSESWLQSSIHLPSSPPSLLLGYSSPHLLPSPLSVPSSFPSPVSPPRAARTPQKMGWGCPGRGKEMLWVASLPLSLSLPL